MTALLLGIIVFAGITAAFVFLRRAEEGPAPWVPVAPPRPDGGAGPTPMPRQPDPADVNDAWEAVQPHRRTAYVPVVADGDGPAAASKFSGVPYLPPGEAWPACGHCGRPMQLFVQLAGDDLPEEARDRVPPGRAVQFFYCTREDTSCEFECDAYAPHAASTLVRLVDVTADAPAAEMPPEMFPPKRIVGWTPVDDYPYYDDAAELGLTEVVEPEDVPGWITREGDKLPGWPMWVQSMEYPDCRICNRRMELLFQVDSENNVPYCFGDLGTGHVTQCPDHREELAFGWACT